jgi:protein O-GlcNAc transferase
VNASVVATWAEILHRVPYSRLFFKTAALACPFTAQRFYDLFASHEIPKERIILCYGVSEKDHFAMYGKVDLALDPFPYNGTTTTCDALWAGVPVVAMEGNAHVSRVSMSILSQLGLAEKLVGKDRENYIERACYMASHWDELNEIRLSLREKMLNTSLCNPDLFIRELEKAYLDMWDTWCSEPHIEYLGKTKT